MGHMDEKSIHHGHRKRMMARYGEQGFDGIQPHEVLEVLLYQSRPRVNTNPIGHRLIEKFGTLEAVFRAKREELMEVEGIGEASANHIASVRETVSDLIREQYRGERDITPYHVAFLTDWFMRAKEGAMGILIREGDGSFLDFRCLYPQWNEEGQLEVEKTFSLSEEDMTEHEFSLFLPEGMTLSEEDVFALRLYTLSRSFVLDEIYSMKGREALPILHVVRKGERAHPKLLKR